MTVGNAYAALIRSLIETYRLADELFMIEPTSEALEAMNAHHNDIVSRRCGDLRDVNIYAARWNEQAWRIAIVLHAAQHGARAREHKLAIGVANRAIELADWFASQQLEILCASRDKVRREIRDGVPYWMRSRKGFQQETFNGGGSCAMLMKRTPFLR